jgi:hypothetical protein
MTIGGPRQKRLLERFSSGFGDLWLFVAFKLAQHRSCGRTPAMAR